MIHIIKIVVYTNADEHTIISDACKQHRNQSAIIFAKQRKILLFMISSFHFTF